MNEISLRLLAQVIFILGFCVTTAAQQQQQQPPTSSILGAGEDAPRRDLLVEPLLQSTSERPAPPPPSLARPGVRQEQTLALTLDESIRRALENNNDIEIARGDVRVAEGVLLSLQGAYDPVLQFAPSYTNNVTPTASSLNGARNDGTIRETIVDFSPLVTKRFEFGGGQYQFFYNNSRRTTDIITSRLNPFYLSSVGVTFTQPLLRDRRIDRFRRDIRVQRRRVSQSDADFRRRTIEVIANVQRAYWDLAFALRDQQNRLSSLNLARAQFSDVEARVTIGDSPPFTRAEVQTEVSTREANLFAATRAVTLAENNLKQLILPDVLAAAWSQTVVPVDQPREDLPAVDLAQALAEARDNRPELQRLVLERAVNDINLDFARNQTRPRVDLAATVSTIGLAGARSPFNSLIGGVIGGATGGVAAPTIVNGQAPIISGDPAINASAFLLQQINQLRQAQGFAPAQVPLSAAQTIAPDLLGGYGQTLGNLAGLNTRSVTVGVNVEIPWRNRAARGQLAVAEAQRTQLAASERQLAQQVETEVRNAVQSVETARRTVAAARAARAAAELQVVGERELYRAGRSTTFLVFQREDSLTNSRTLELRAETDYNAAYADLQRATGTTLRANNITFVK